MYICRKSYFMYRTPKIFSVFLCLLLLPMMGYAQIEKFKIVDEQNQYVPFANVYVKSSAYGTMSDEKGNLSLDLSKVKSTDTIQISCIGFEDQFLIKSKLLALPNNTIKLTATDYTLSEMEVSAERTKFRKRKVGIKTQLDLCQNGFFINKGNIGQERGIVIENEETCYIESIHFNLTYASHDSMLYEVNLYDYNNGIGEPINTERIFILVTKDNTIGTINISDQYIKVSNDFFVSFEAIQAKEDNWGIIFKAKCRSDIPLFVKQTDGTWKNEKAEILMLKMTPAIWCRMNCIAE